MSFNLEILVPKLKIIIEFSSKPLPRYRSCKPTFLWLPSDYAACSGPHEVTSNRSSLWPYLRAQVTMLEAKYLSLTFNARTQLKSFWHLHPAFRRPLSSQIHRAPSQCHTQVAYYRLISNPNRSTDDSDYLWELVLIDESIINQPHPICFATFQKLWTQSKSMEAHSITYTAPRIAV